MLPLQNNLRKTDSTSFLNLLSKLCMYTGWGLEPVSPAQSTSDVNFDMCHKPIKNPSNTP